MKRSTVFGLAAGMALLASSPVLAQGTAGNNQLPSTVTYTLDPAPDQQVSGDADEVYYWKPVFDLSTVTVTFTGETRLFFYDNNDNNTPVAVITNENNSDDVYYCYNDDVDPMVFTAEGYNQYTLHFKNDKGGAPVFEPGNYVLTLRTLCTDATNSATVQPWIYAYYTVYPEVDWTFDPLPGIQYNPENRPYYNIVDSLTDITVTFTNPNVGYYENTRPWAASIENQATGETYGCLIDDLGRNENGERSYKFTFIDENDEVVTITEPGTWTLTLKGFYITVFDAETEQEVDYDFGPIVADFWVYYTADYELKYENHSTLPYIDGLWINFTNIKNIGFDPNQLRGTLALATLTQVVGGKAAQGQGSVYYGYEAQVMKDFQTDGVAYSFYFVDENGNVVQAIDEPGIYELVLSGIYLNINGEQLPLPNITAYYYIPTIDPKRDLGITWNLIPAPGYVEELYTIAVNFQNNGYDIGFNENARPFIATLSNTIDEEETIFTCYADNVDFNPRSMNPGITYILTFLNEDDEPMSPINGTDEDGKWNGSKWYLSALKDFYVDFSAYGFQIEIPINAGSIATEDGTLTPKPFEYIIGYPEEYYVYLNANNEPYVTEVEALLSVAVYFPEVNNLYYKQSTATLVDQFGNTYVSYLTQPINNTTSVPTGTKVVYYFVPEGESGTTVADATTIDTPGIYTLTIYNLGVPSTTGKLNFLPNIYRTITIGDYEDIETGVASVFSANEKLDVYTTTGIQVVKDGNVESLNSLANGIYIINGKKVVVRK